MNNKYIILAGLCLLGIADSSNAARQRITLAPDPGIYTKADIEKEIIFGREMAAIILADHKLSNNKGLTGYLNLVGQSILQHANRSEINFYFAAIESSEINAYAVPGGYIFITTSALNMMQNEAELAGVLAHEIAHISDRHIVKALKIRADDKSMIAIVSKIVGSSVAESAIVVFNQAVDHALELLFSKGLKVNDEYNADKQGLFLAALAGYEPAAFYRFLERIKPVIESYNGEISSTHPPFSERIIRIKKIIDDEGLSGLGSFKNEERFALHSLTRDKNDNIQK